MTSDAVNAREPRPASTAMVAALAVVVVVFVALVAVALVRPDDQERTYFFAIPAGAATMDEERQVALGGPPSTLRLQVGDTIEVTNDDAITHTYSFLVLAPGETGRYTFTTEGRFMGDCTFVAHETVTITVDS